MGLFDKLESKLEQGVNGAFARAFKSEVQPVEIASGIRRAMDDRAASVGRGKRPIVPNLFTVELSPTDYERLCAWGDELDDELIASAQEHADEQRYLPGGPLTVVLAESDSLETGVFRLRPATAKAADALAHQRQHPRLSRQDADQAHSTRHGAGDERDHAAHGDDDHGYDEAHDASEYDEPYAASRYDAYDESPTTHDDSTTHRTSGASAAGASYAGNAGTPGNDARRGTAPGGFAADGAPMVSQGNDRPFAVRIKDYLMGSHTTDASGADAGRGDDARRAQVRSTDEHYDEAPGHDEYSDHEYDDAYTSSGYDHHDGSADDDAYGTYDGHAYESEHHTADDEHDAHASDHHGQYDEYDSGRSGFDGNSGFDDGEPSRFREDDERHARTAAASAPAAARGPVKRAAAPARPATSAASARTSRQAHAWDDDDSDYGDPTGYEPAPTAAPNRPRAMSPRERPWLKIEGQRYPLLGAITVLGRDDDADIVVDDPGVSRRHSEIRITHDGPHLVMSVRDLGSTNGTYVNGDLIDSAHVHDGDRLTLGRTPMTIHLGDRP